MAANPKENFERYYNEPINDFYLEDEIVACKLQLEEAIECESKTKGKHPVHNIPDFELAYDACLDDVEWRLQFLQDAKLARSTANAVDTDGEVISKIQQAEMQAKQDDLAALKGTDNKDGDAILIGTDREISRADHNHRFSDTETNAGPSEPYVLLRFKALKKLGDISLKCTACIDSFCGNEVTMVPCYHVYCEPCLKRLILNGVVNHDLRRIPPRCCGVQIHRQIITSVLTDTEIAMLDDAYVEKGVLDKTYCSGTDCGKFIAPRYIDNSRMAAVCPSCKAETCVRCKSGFHENDCPADPALQATLALGEENHWRRCYSCRALVQLEDGCIHIICRCGAAFCYRCGARWGQCPCAM